MNALRLGLVASLFLTACSATPPEPAASVSTDGGFFAPFDAPSLASIDDSVLITVTGEAAATEGTAFPPATDGEPYFVDGWEVHYEHVLLTIGDVTLSENPDRSPTDPSLFGADVASHSGPWAVDLANPGALDAKEGNGKALALTRFTSQNLKSGRPAFDTSSKYALGFTLVTAGEGARAVNLDDAAQSAYRTMAQRGWVVMLIGTATWKGERGTPACRSTDSTYDFSRFPKAVHFSLGFATPMHFKNCINPELSPVDSRGVQTVSNAQTLAQLTFHLDHPFWEALIEDAPLRFDTLAARKSVAVGPGPALVELSTDDLAFDLLAPRDAQGAAVPWRHCGPLQPFERSSGTLSLDPMNVPVNPLGGAAGLADVGGYMTYNLSTFGHLNNDGLCYPERQYPSPR